MMIGSWELDPVDILIIFIVVSILLFIILFFIAYKVFFSGSFRHDYHLLGDDAFRYGDVPREFINDEESLTHLAEEYDFTHLSPEEQNSYLKGEEYTKSNPPNFHNIRGKSFTPEDEVLIKDCGINAFEFEQEHDILLARYIVADRTEIHFLNNDTPYSTATSVLNYCLPVKNRTYSDTVYFEVKVFEYDTSNENGHFAIGLVTKPYPLSFRLPGYNNFSIAYESTGNLKINKPFPTPLQQHMGDNSKFNAQVLPPLSQSDTVGFGYVISTGTVFITRNGKKLMDILKDCYVDLYPAVGCFSTNAKFQANLGQLGYVWIEANVRKYGFISTSDYKKIKGDRGLAALPQYGSINKSEGDKLLDKGEELPPDYPEDELDFFGRSTKDLVRIGSSSKSNKNNEQTEKNEKSIDSKQDDEEFKEPKVPISNVKSSSLVTDEPEEIMDLRGRLYEQEITSRKTDDDSETTPLIKSTLDNDSNYQTTDGNETTSINSKKEPTPHSEAQVEAKAQQHEVGSASASSAAHAQEESTNPSGLDAGETSTESPEPTSNPIGNASGASAKPKSKKKKKNGKKSNKKKGKKSK